MLLGKAYSTWEGHTGDAIAVYDNIIASHPDDFRGYLAKVNSTLFMFVAIRINSLRRIFTNFLNDNLDQFLHTADFL